MSARIPQHRYAIIPRETECFAAYDEYGHCWIIEFETVSPGGYYYPNAWRRRGFHVKRTTYGQADDDMRTGIAARAAAGGA